MFGGVLTWEDCFERADLLCKGRSYDVYTGRARKPDHPLPSRSTSATIPTTNRRMVIACKGRDPLSSPRLTAPAP